MKFSDLDLDKTYTYADYLQWTFDERLEIIKGKIFKMSPAPGSMHQRLSLKLTLKINNYLSGKECEIFTAPFDVRLPRRFKGDKEVITVVQPDICVICDSKKIDSNGCNGAPDIIEILSPGNYKKELKNKYDVYQEAGVLEYWIVRPETKEVSIYKLVNRTYQGEAPLIVGDVVTSPILPGFELSLDELFKND